MKLFHFKEHIEQDNTETDTKEEVKAKKRKKYKPKAIPTNPHELMRAMTRAHQTATLTVGTLKANTKQLKLKNRVQVGNLIKRRAQVALAIYVSKEGENGLKSIRQAISNSKSSSDDMNDDDNNELGRADSKKFFNILLINMCNGKTPTKSQHFETLSAIFKLYYSKFPGQKNTPAFNKEKQHIYPSALFQSIGNAIAVQYKRYFQETDATKNSSLPLAPIRNGFILISERELISMLWGNKVMREQLEKDGLTSHTPTSIAKFMKYRTPGGILNKYLTPIGLG
ncbi:hypothetical protein BGZ46_005206 [Entomortierella lignicola]|nr:hypothetical protein BGZ46_005206 [Entomortierella lignicola]